MGILGGYKAFNEILDGNFVLNQTYHTFNQVSTDQALENINSVCKVTGGLIGIQQAESARDQWCMTIHQHSNLVQEACAMF